MKLKPSQLASLLTKVIPAKIPLLVVGPPGVGKTDIIKQACITSGADIIVVHPVVSDPTDAKGMPWVENGEA
jgi:MoxR-like ATPase